MRLAPGDTFDRYTIEAPLGEGGMGEVYLATDTRLHRRVALKLLRSTKADAETWGRAVARMLREARAAAALNHPNVVAIFDVGEINGEPYLAMELVVGTPLRRLIGSGVPLRARLSWLCDAARALSAAHRAGLVHRDIKPENVMLRDDGVIKVLDFGIARNARLDVDTSAKTVSAGMSTLTSQGSFVGTPAYMAPEQIRGDPLDGRADQFAWGVLAYELLSGTLPFGSGRDAMGMLAAVLTAKEAPLTGVPEAAAVIIHRALSKSPDERFASMDEIIEALSTLDADAMGAEGGPTSVSRRNGSGPQTTPIRHSEAPVRTDMAGDKSDSAPTSAPAPRRPATGPIVAAVGAVLLLSALIMISIGRTDAPPLIAVPALARPLSGAVPVPTPITETAPPKTQSPEALSAYREGLQAFRDSAWSVAHEAFQRAVKLDPAFAAAYLRLTITSRHMAPLTEMRPAYQKTVALRAMLGERDQVLLDALEPQLFRQPPDRAETQRRLQAARQRYPGDAEFVALLLFERPSNDPAAEMALAEQCLALDGAYADCLQAKAISLIRMRRFDEAESALDRCLTLVPSAHDCLQSRADLRREHGQCDKYEEDARDLMARLQGSAYPYTHLAAALYSRGVPLGTVRTALQQSWIHSPEPQRETVRLRDEASLALLSGRFAEAERLTKELQQKVALDPTEQAHVDPANFLIQIYRETGRPREAGAVADATLTGLGAWEKSIHATAVADPSLWLLHAKMHAGMISAEDFAAKRESWLRDASKTAPLERNAAAWFAGYATLAITEAEAKEALAKMPPQPSISNEISFYAYSETMGRLYWLAGRGDEARPHLASAASQCGALLTPFSHTRVEYQLGEVLASRGDKAGACAAFKVVLDRWGAAKASVTARAAAARARAIGCAM